MRFAFGCTLLIFLGLLTSCTEELPAQAFFFGADLSYVNELEDCGVVYRETGVEKDPYAIFADHDFNLVRLRLWHTPSWYDALNSGQRYSDLVDVARSIERAHAVGMQVLLNFQLSDNWADPSKQIVPAAWESVVDDQQLLGDSLYQYIYGSLNYLHEQDLLPALVQIGNETNRGILLTQAQNDAGWVLDWERNSYLFNRAISAVRDFEAATNSVIELGLHIAGPANAAYFVDEFIANGVTDFDWIGLSYYWAWHQPTTIAETGDVIAQFRADYPDKDVIILETGYIWTLEANDSANNIISETHPDYAPPSPEAQYHWLVDLTQEVLESGGRGVLYWEPAWVSSACFTQWGQGSHQEHATFFDFTNQVLSSSGLEWPQAEFTTATFSSPPWQAPQLAFSTFYDPGAQQLQLDFDQPLEEGVSVQLVHLDGALLQQWEPLSGQVSYRLNLPDLPNALYFLVLEQRGRWVGKSAVVVQR
ncbi:MAG: glycosyl hydrolase 53 family protein [Bacteroidota bacterium]